MSGPEDVFDRNLRRALGAGKEQLERSYDEFLRRLEEPDRRGEDRGGRSIPWGGLGMAAALAVCALVLWTILLPGAAPEPRPARQEAEPAPVPAEVEALLRKLGDSDPSAREEATRKLVEMGERAAPFVKEALKSTDAEVAGRARRILDEIYRPILELPAETRRQIREIEQYVQDLRAAKRDREADALDAEFAKVRRQIMTGRWEPASEPEVHVVGIYEPKSDTDQGAVVRVTFCAAPVILVLCAYEQTFWKVEVAKEADVRKVLLGGYFHQEVEGLPKGVPVERYVYEDKKGGAHFEAYSTDDDSYAEMAAVLRKLTGRGMTTFQGAYRYSGEPFVVGDASAAWAARRKTALVARFHEEHMREARLTQLAALGSFWAVVPAQDRAPRGSTQMARLTMAGIQEPLDVTERLQHIVVRAESGKAWGVTSNDLCEVDLKTGKCTPVEQEKRADLPRLSWADGVAYDTKRARLIIFASAGANAYAYAVDPAKNSWTLLWKDQPRDRFGGVTYSEEDDAFYAVRRVWHSPVTYLSKLDPDASRIEDIRLSEPIPVGKDDAMPSVQNVWLGKGRLALVVPPVRDSNDGKALGPAHAYLIDAKTGEVLMSEPLRSK